MSKICKTCAREVDDSANFCPYCKGRSFRAKNEVATPKNDPVHKLFYWNYGGQYVLSKGKVASIIVFLVFTVLALPFGAPWAVLFLAVIFSAITYLLSFGLHKIIGPPIPARASHNDYGLGRDLINLFFFWQNEEGEYVLSKTKLISHIIFIGFFIFALTAASPILTPLAAFFFALFFEVPAFAIGFAIHKLTNPNPQPKIEHKQPKKPKIEHKEPKIPTRQTPTTHTIPEYVDYAMQIDNLNARFIKKEKSTRDLIAKRFEPPQLTYTRFITGVDKSSELFKKHRDSAYTMLNLADEYSPRIAGEIESKIDILREILDKMDSLSNELVVNDSITSKEDVDDLIGEMDDLIKSVKEYES
jgi:hypothetical protein